MIITTCLLSGGLDSSVALAQIVREGQSNRSIRALHIQYGQRHERERDSASEIADHFRVVLDQIDIPLPKIVKHSALTSPCRDVPLDRDQSEPGIPITYVPMRNTVLVALAAAHLESRVLDLIEREIDVTGAEIVIGANVLDYSGYPDCRPEFYDRMAFAMAAGSKIAEDHGIPISIHAPLIALNKNQIVNTARALGVPIDLTWSCYLGGDSPCGRCDSCIIRDKAIKDTADDYM